MTRPENRNYACTDAFVEELARAGLRHVCICPGSRSTPLTIAFARNPRIRPWLHFDERSASFFALGMARVLREPVAVVCTSGTAAANFYPAVIEARYANVPLIVLTADRPPEMWDWGAAQSIDQVKMYGAHVKWSATMAVPETSADLLRYVRATAVRVVATALESPAGPVHVDFPFREPLEPLAVVADVSERDMPAAPDAWRGRADKAPYQRVHATKRACDTAQVAEIAASLRKVERGVIVCGPQDDAALPEAVAALAAKLAWPVLADPLSQARCGAHDRRLVVDSYDAFLRDPAVAKALAPDAVLRFGPIPTSKPVLTWMQALREKARHVLVQDGSWQDPAFLAADVVRADAATFARDLAAALPHAPSDAWARRWTDTSSVARRVAHRQATSGDELFEGRVFAELASLLPERATLFAGNSMPVRDMDTFYPSTAQHVRFMANRGVNGIDGVVSTALGAAAALPDDPLTLVIGDISFYHDMNGLLAARQHKLNATIIVVNNDGGGIFSFLPQSAYPDYFETYFGTPHGMTFESAAAQYGLRYTRVDSWAAFRDAVGRGVTSEGTAIIEVPGDRAKNVALHRHIWPAVAEALKPMVADRP